MSETGGSPGLRDLGLLESAVQRPRSSAGGDDANRSVFDKAAALMHSLSLNHPFVDGNKRTGFAATVLFLQANGHRPEFETSEAVDFCVRVAGGSVGVAEIAQWLRRHT